jgi:hypothetical protein
MRKILIVLFSILFVLILVVGALAYYVFVGPSHKTVYSSSGRILPNPTAGLTDEQAVGKFDESFVYYILVGIKANDLHNPPFSSDTPKIKFYIDNDVFNAEINDGSIQVNKGEIGNSDIAIRTTKLEAVKMTRDGNYIKTSFSNGGSNIELLAGKTTLAMKGYWNIYNELSGQ